MISGVIDTRVILPINVINALCWSLDILQYCRTSVAAWMHRLFSASDMIGNTCCRGNISEVLICAFKVHMY